MGERGVASVSDIENDDIPVMVSRVIGTARFSESGTLSGMPSFVATTVPSATANTSSPYPNQFSLRD